MTDSIDRIKARLVVDADRYKGYEASIMPHTVSVEDQITVLDIADVKDVIDRIDRLQAALKAHEDHEGVAVEVHNATGGGWMDVADFFKESI